MKRTPLKRKKPLRSKSATFLEREKPGLNRAKRLRSVSERRKRDLLEYYEAVKVAKESHHTCQKCGQEFWSNLNLDAHHPFGRTNHNLYRFILLCRPCHDWVHEHPNEAYQLGWLQPEYKRYVPNSDHPVPWKILHERKKLTRDEKPRQLRSAGKKLEGNRRYIDWKKPILEIAAEVGVAPDSVRAYMRANGMPYQDGRKNRKARNALP